MPSVYLRKGIQVRGAQQRLVAYFALYPCRLCWVADLKKADGTYIAYRHPIPH